MDGWMGAERRSPVIKCQMAEELRHRLRGGHPWRGCVMTRCFDRDEDEDGDVNVTGSGLDFSSPSASPPLSIYSTKIRSPKY